MQCHFHFRLKPEKKGKYGEREGYCLRLIHIKMHKWKIQNFWMISTKEVIIF